MLIVPVCRAIEYAHGRGVLHRDLKPSNVLIDRAGTPYVADFGLARRIDVGSGEGGLTRSGAVVGTPAYMSPEQASGSRGRLGPASDVYGIGAVLYHMLTGRPPVQAANAVDAILAALEHEPLPPRLLSPAVDRELEMIVMKCLQKPPELRYATAGELADDLEAWLRGDPISVRAISVPLLLGRMFRETHHATILENWGLLWMWHAAVLVIICTATNAFQWVGIRSHLAHLTLWLAGLGTWASIFWALRKRAGPVTFVERQIAHVWAASVLASSALYLVEFLMELPALSLSPVLPLIGGMVFVAKAGILSGSFYIQAAALFLTPLPMVHFPEAGLTIFGAVSAACFFVPGLRYARRRRGARGAPPVAAGGEI
jgi:serine/threonine-protein kinase